MKRFAFALLLIGIFLVVTAPTAGAFQPPNDRLYPPLSYKSAVVESIKATNTATYVAIDNYGWSGWRSLVNQSLDTGSSYSNSLGNILTAAVPGFTLREARPGEAPTIQQIAVTAAAQQTYCNDPSGWSVACAYLLNPLPAPTYYKASTMQLYPFVSQAAVIEHESFHHVARACDQYVGGCPPTNSQGVQCTGNPDSLMDCSLGNASLSARWAQPFDVETFLQATGFKRGPACVGDPCYDGSKWNFAKCPIAEGVSCSWSPSPAPYGIWIGPDGVVLWDACDPTWNGRHTPLAEPGWFHVGQGFIPDRLRYWTYAPAC